MPRLLTIAAAQLGPVHLTASRAETLQRCIALLQLADKAGAKLVVFPEIAFTTFFPRHLIALGPELEAYFDDADTLLTSPGTRALFEKAGELRLDIEVGFAERARNGDGFNTSVYFSGETGDIIAKYRFVSCPYYSIAVLIRYMEQKSPLARNEGTICKSGRSQSTGKALFHTWKLRL